MSVAVFSGIAELLRTGVMDSEINWRAVSDVSISITTGRPLNDASRVYDTLEYPRRDRWSRTSAVTCTMTADTSESTHVIAMATTGTLGQSDTPSGADFIPLCTRTSNPA